MIKEKRIGLAFVFMVSIFALVPILTTPTVFATPPIMATGIVTAGTYKFTEVRTADGNTFLKGTFDADTFTGTFTGTAPNMFSLVLNPSGLHVQLYFTFTGTVDGKSGTCVIKFQGHGEGIGMPIKGTWVILSGTGGLANLHGELSVEGTAGVILYYTGQIHFDP